MRANNVLGILYSDAYNDNISDLTALRTAGSVPFGGRYRFIDFPLSNMVNSGIIKVGVIAKNNYRSLMDHVGSGKSWDLSRKNAGLFILPPYNFGGGQYSGRLEALRNTMDFIQASKEEYVLLENRPAKGHSRQLRRAEACTFFGCTRHDVPRPCKIQSSCQEPPDE